MAKPKADLRKSEWREAVEKVAKALKDTQLTDRALALLISDSSGVGITNVRKVIDAIRNLEANYLKD